MEHATRPGSIGDRIKGLRRSRGLTASRLAERVGITENALRKIESGNSKEPRFSTGVRIAKALGIDPADLVAHAGLVGGAALSPAVVLASLRAVRTQIVALGVRHVDLFGSTARGEADGDSDIDLLVEPIEGKSLSLFAQAEIASIAERALNRSVDVVTRRSLAPNIAQRIEGETLRAF